MVERYIVIIFLWLFWALNADSNVAIILKGDKTQTLKRRLHIIKESCFFPIYVKYIYQKGYFMTDNFDTEIKKV